MGVGLCLPEECTLEDVESFKETLLKGVQAAIPNMFEDVKGFDRLNEQITIEDLRIVEPRVENKKVTEVTAGSVVTIALMSTFVVLALGSTVVVYRKN